uniref:Carrier domain-containing protein n=1 Tax=Hemiselmis tepida TaxID=464990 RepID=A0A6T6VJ03_9CRYP|mmetsp:Transcript_30928/g.78301  ORF Transcript_30928/g.78301 Transcript_30928/m.78301 type:complete len:1379 (+) Transcript_30928:256-4392(+)
MPPVHQTGDAATARNSAMGSAEGPIKGATSGPTAAGSVTHASSLSGLTFSEALTTQAAKSANAPCLLDFPGAETAADVMSVSPRVSTHAEVHALAEKIAAILGAASSGASSSVVAIVLPRSPAMTVAQLAVFKAGLTFAPLDPEWPVERHHGILDELKPLAIITDTEQATPPYERTALLRIDTAGAVKVAPSVAEPLVKKAETKLAGAGGQLPPNECMYIMYTSGSTGRPKGVSVPTAGFWQRTIQALQIQGCTSQDVFLMKTVYTFDVSVPEIWESLVLGATTCVLGAHLHLDAEAILATMNRGNVTASVFVPSLLDLFLDNAEGVIASGRQTRPKNLRYIHCIGEALLRTHHAKLKKVLGDHVKLWNFYGPTEATVDVTTLDCDSEDAKVDEDSTTGFSLGFPHKGVTMYITDLEDPTKEMPKGERGEICIGGIQVAMGYLERPELTAERFVPNKLDSTGGNIYRTGDIGRIHPERGFFEYFGRADRQVKIGGVRLELGEIEGVADERLQGMVKMVAIEAIDGLLVGVASLLPNHPITSQELNHALADQLPQSHLPSEWMMRRDTLPINAAGKLDHKAITAWIQEKRRIKMWGHIYSTMYEDMSTSNEENADPTMDWAAYFDSFTNLMHTRDVIEEWVRVTCDWVLSYKPKSVLEMGCGKGMLLFKIAPYMPRFTGADISGYALEHVQKVWDNQDPKEHGICTDMQLAEGDAADYTGLVDAGLYDLTLCNGVTMYFPSATYLYQHLQGAIESTVPGGIVFLGDVRALSHQLLFHMRKLVHIENVSRADVYKAGLASRAKDKDRCYDHHMFYDMLSRGMLPGVAAIEIQIKRGKHSSEFTRYRYDVVLHLSKDRNAEPPAALPVRQATGTELMEADAVVAALKAAGPTQDDVVVSRNVVNTRILADVRLLRGEAGDEASPVEVGVCACGGVEVHELREKLAAAFPDHMSVVTWSKDMPLFSTTGLPVDNVNITHAEHMDVYLVPKTKMHAGLNSISVEGSVAGSIKFGLEDFCNEVPKEDDLAAPAAKKDATDLDALAHEAQEICDSGHPEAAVCALLAGALGVSDMDAKELRNQTLIELGGNSFLAMRIAQKLTTILGGKSVPVFSLLTKTIGSFTDEITGHSAAAGWILDQSTKVDNDNGKRPQFVFFPTAGGSPRVYAATYAEIRSRMPSARCLFVQPPGRDARASEPHETDLKKVMEGVMTGLKGHLQKGAPLIVVGDSLGSCLAWQFVHEYHAKTGVLPDHICVSGNPGPRIASEQLGLGYLAKRSIREESDEDLGAFLRKGGADDDINTIRSLQCDCILYEDFKRGDKPKLNVPATLFRGAQDPIGGPAEDMRVWNEEFSSMTEVVVEDAGHHIYSDQPAFMASKLLALVQ